MDQWLIFVSTVVDSSYKRQGDSEIITTGYRITGKMENNPNFTDAPPELEEAKQLLPELQTSVSNAKGRDIEAVNLKNETKRAS